MMLLLPAETCSFYRRPICNHRASRPVTQTGNISLIQHSKLKLQGNIIEKLTPVHSSQWVLAGLYHWAKFISNLSCCAFYTPWLLRSLVNENWFITRYRLITLPTIRQITFIIQSSPPTTNNCIFLEQMQTSQDDYFISCSLWHVCYCVRLWYCVILCQNCAWLHVRMCAPCTPSSVVMTTVSAAIRK